jgi:hypothetical protein
MRSNIKEVASRVSKARKDSFGAPIRVGIGHINLSCVSGMSRKSNPQAGGQAQAAIALEHALSELESPISNHPS